MWDTIASDKAMQRAHTAYFELMTRVWQASITTAEVFLI
ncbi:hypothetical protein CVT24_008760 [Panaeolus cyanescens]|uniref:Uncharacterized protein n=1 Tax=Panaeolus cyanescens TaxID=181874 RepID=A0A409YX09_9AGAR|nr:hypothetical protein CVT24_008760 [Panaeolus cyanescens]